MRFYYDTEFLEDGSTINLISIGIVADNGAEFYAVNRDADWGRIYSDPWLAENVVPHLGPSENYVFRDALADWVHKFIWENADETPTQLWAYYGAYDHVALCQLWGKMMTYRSTYRCSRTISSRTRY